MSASTVDPYAVARALRAGGEIVPVNFRQAAGLAPTVASIAEADWTALSYDTVRTILQDHGAFSSRAYVEHGRKLGAASILSMDQPEHKAHRNLVSAGFFAQSVKEWAGRVVPVVLDRLIERLLQREGPVDLVKEFTSIFPIQVIASVVGADETDYPLFLDWIQALLNFDDYEGALAAGEAMQRYLTALVAERRARPRDDLASALVSAEIDGAALADPAIVAFLAQLLTAGGETTVRSIGTTLVALLSDEAQLAAVRADRRLAPRAIEEALRWESPVQTLRRVATRDSEVAGRRITAGAYVTLHLGSANRDPAYWDEPDEFDLHRPPKPHIAFGAGPHVCLGVNLARFEAEAAIQVILDRLPLLRLAPDGRKPVIGGLEMRGPDNLDVTWSPV